MSTTFAKALEEDRKLTLLKALECADGYCAAQFILSSYCEQFGHRVSLDRIRADLAWLAEQSLVTLAKPDDVYVATLTARGLDVATGRARVPGVAVPKPGL